MTRKKREMQIKEEKKTALKNVPREIKDLYINVTKAKDKRPTNEILMELRYGNVGL